MIWLCLCGATRKWLLRLLKRPTKLFPFNVNWRESRKVLYALIFYHEFELNYYYFWCVAASISTVSTCIICCRCCRWRSRWLLWWWWWCMCWCCYSVLVVVAWCCFACYILIEYVWSAFRPRTAPGSGPCLAECLASNDMHGFSKFVSNSRNQRLIYLFH